MVPARLRLGLGPISTQGGAFALRARDISDTPLSPIEVSPSDCFGEP